LKDTRKSMRLLAIEEEYGPPASPLPWPKSGELKLSMGVARLTLLKTFRADTLKVKLSRLSNRFVPSGEVSRFVLATKSRALAFSSVATCLSPTTLLR